MTPGRLRAGSRNLPAAVTGRRGRSAPDTDALAGVQGVVEAAGALVPAGALHPAWADLG